MKKLAERLRGELAQRRRSRRMTTTLTAVAGILVFLTVYTLILPALALEEDAYCGIEAHEHSKDCYEQVLTCKLEEHVHSDSCYDADGNLTCGKKEHSHSDSCYKEELTCGKSRHVHTVACYEKPEPEEVTKASTQIHDEVALAAKSVEKKDVKKAANGTTSQKKTDKKENDDKDSEESASTAQKQEEIKEFILSEHFTDRTGIWVSKNTDDQENVWEKLEKKSKIDTDSLVRVHFAYRIPKDALDGYNFESVYTLPETIAMNQEIADWLNDDTNAVNQVITGKATPDKEASDDAYLAGKYEIIQNEDDQWQMVITWDPYILAENLKNTIDVWTDMYLTGNELLPDAKGNYKIILAEESKENDEVAVEFAGVKEARKEDAAKDSTEAESDEGSTDQTTADKASDKKADDQTADDQTAAKDDKTTDNTDNKDAAATDDGKSDNTEAKADEKKAGADDKTDKSADRADSKKDDASINNDNPGNDSASTEDEKADSKASIDENSARSLSFDGEDYTVTVTYDDAAALPEDVKLDVREIKEDSTEKVEQKEFEKYFDQASQIMRNENNANVTSARFFDITFMSGQKEIEPAAPVNVKIEYKKAEKIDQDAEVSAIHMPEKEKSEILDVEVNADKKGVKEVEFTAESFSVYGIIYTVDFEYEVNGRLFKFKLNGGEEVTLSHLSDELDILNIFEFDSIDDFIGNVDKVEFSNETLVKVEKETKGGFLGIGAKTVDWILKSLQPFNSEEMLTITMKNGIVVSVAVTDAQEVAGNDFITDAKLEIDGETYGKNDTWTVYPDIDYTLTLSFAEKGSRQFPVGGDTIVINLPSGLTIPDGTTGSFDIPAGLAGTIYGNTYRVENGKLYVTFGNDPDDILTRSSTAHFDLTFTAKFDGDSGELHFNDNVHPNADIKTDNDVSVTKTGSYNSATGQMDYVVTVKSTGKSENIVVTDSISGSAITLDQDSITISPSKTLTNPIDASDNGFTLTIGEMAHNETVTIRYSADIDSSYLGDDFKIINANTNGKNTIRVENDDYKTDEQDFTYNNEIKYSNISKSNTDVNDSEDSTTLEWTIIANDNFRGSIVGGTISDRISWNSKDVMKYSDPLTLSIVAKNKQGTVVKEWEEPVTVNDNGGQESWSYIIPNLTEIEGDDEVLSYEITYTTVVDKTKMAGWTNGAVTNETENDHGGSSTGTGIVPGIGGGGDGEEDSITAVKNATTVTKDYIDWDIVVVVPAEGFDSLRVVDNLPSTNSGDGYRDTLEGEPTVTGLLDNEQLKESFDWELSYNHDLYKVRDGETLLREIVTMDFSYTDENGVKHAGLASTGSTRTITIKIRTQNDEPWVEEGTTNSYFSTHTNRAVINGHEIQATGRPVKPNVVKTGKQEGTINGTTVLKYDIMLSGITEEPVVLDDYFDTEYLEFVPYSDLDSGAQQAYYIEYGVDTYSNDHSDQNVPVFTLVDADGNTAAGDNIDRLHIVADNLAKQEDGSYYPFYHIRYWLRVKDDKADTLISEAIANKGSVTIGNSVKWGDIDDDVDIDVNVPVNTKEGWFRDEAVNGYNKRMYDFVIDINPSGYQVNGGEAMELTDTHTSNLSVEYNTVKAYRVTDPEVNAALYKEVLQYENEKKSGTIDGWKQTKIDKFYNGTSEATEVYWNFDGNIGTFGGIQDETHYLITYSTLVVGSNTQEFSNEADMEGFIATKTGRRDFGNEASAGADVYQIGLLKHMKGKTSEGLPGAVFQLYRGTGTFSQVPGGWFEEDRVPMTWGEGTETKAKGIVGQNITFTTGEDGYVLIALDQTRHGAELEEGVHYFLKEVDSPPGYTIDSSVEYWEFTLTEDPDEVCYGTKRDEYGNRLWIYFYYDDILRMTNTPTTDPVTVDVDKTWLDFDGTELDMTAEENKNLSATVQLYQKTDDGEYTAVTGTIESQDGNKTFDGTVTLNSTNDWKYSWEDLPRDDGEHKYAYRLEETVSPAEFASSIQENETETTKTYKITNQKVEEKNVSVSVKKEWKKEDGETNLTENLPERIRFYLYRVVSRTPFTYVPTSGGNKYTIENNPYLVTNENEEGLYEITASDFNGVSFDNLPSVKQESGNWYFYSYYVKEVPMEGYSSSLDVSQESGSNTILVNTLTNTKLPEPMEIKIRKEWQDDTGDPITPPDKEIQYKLYQVSSSQPFTTQPTSGGTLYDVIISQNQGGNNTYHPSRVQDTPGTYMLGYWGNVDTETWEAGSTNTRVWGVNFHDLPANSVDDKGRVTYYAYYITEDPVEGYDSTVTPVLNDDGTYTFTMTNKVHPESTRLTVDKTWLNKDGALPLLVDRSEQEVAVQIYRVAGDLGVGKAVINGNNDNPVNISDLISLDIKEHGNSTKQIARSGDIIEITVTHTGGNNIDPSVRIYTISDPWGNTRASETSDSNSENKKFQITVSEDMTGIEVSDSTGGQYTVTATNKSINTVQYILTQEEALSVGGTPYGDPLTITGNGSVTSGDLPVVSKGVNYTYYIVEPEGTDYNAEYVLDGDMVHLTNKEPDMLEVDKKWLDANGDDITKTDGEVTYTLHQLASEKPVPSTVTVDYSDLTYGHPDWSEPLKAIPSISFPEEGIKTGSTIQIYIKHPDNQSSVTESPFTGLIVNGVFQTPGDAQWVTDENYQSHVENYYTIENVSSNLILSGNLLGNQYTGITVVITVLEGPDLSNQEETGEPTDTPLGTFTVAYDSIVSTTLSDASYSVVAGRTPWSALIGGLLKEDSTYTYKYYVEETEVTGFTKSGDGSDDSVNADGKITVSNTQDQPPEKTGTVFFTAKKEFTNGSLSEKTFSFRLTQVTAGNSTTQASSNVVLDTPQIKTTDSSGDVVFDTITFTKNSSIDQTGTYWFMVEEVLPEGVTAEDPIKNNIKYDTTKKWIKVTVADDGEGNLTVTKDPAVTSGTPDAAFTNEQLGNLKIQKTGTVNGLAPNNDNREKIDGDYSFTIVGKPGSSVANYNATIKITLVNGVATSVVKEGISNPADISASVDSGVVKVDNLPIGTYTVTEILTDEQTAAGISLSEDSTNPQDIVVSSAAQDIQTATFVNNVDMGKLQIKKTVTYNETTPSADKKALFEGNYTFTVCKDENGLEPYPDADNPMTFTVHIGSDAADAVSEVKELPPGDYWIREEVADDAQVLPIGENPQKVTVSSSTGDSTTEVTIHTIQNDLHVNEKDDDLTLDIEKKFDGINGTNIPNDFQIVISYTLNNSEHSIVLKCENSHITSDGLSVNITHSDDSLEWKWHVYGINEAGTDFRIKEINYTKPGYELSISYNGNVITPPETPEDEQTVPLTAEAATLTQVAGRTTSQTNLDHYILDDEYAVLVAITGNVHGTAVVSKRSLNMAERDAITKGIRDIPNGPFDNSNMWFYSEEEHFIEGQDVIVSPVKNRDLTFKTVDGEHIIVCPPSSNKQAIAYSIRYEGKPSITNATYINNYTEKVPLEILKIDKEGLDFVKDEQTPLQGAIFTITQLAENGSGTYMPKVNENNEVVNGEFAFQKDFPATGTDGKTQLDDLFSGYFVIEETQSPENYILLKEPVYIKIEDGVVSCIEKDPDKAVKEWKVKTIFNGLFRFEPAESAVEDDPDTSADETAAASNAIFTVGNEQGIPLPQTGGFGTKLLYTLGSILVFLSGALLLIRRRRLTPVRVRNYNSHHDFVASDNLGDYSNYTSQGSDRSMKGGGGLI